MRIVLLLTMTLVRAGLAPAAGEVVPPGHAKSNAAKPWATPPYGAADFVPTTETPVFFRNGNGYYPGATPPTEWWEGTPTQIQLGGVYGNPPARRTAKVWDFADTKSKNIRWKVPVPGWSLAHPIVVGDRVFVVGQPHFVACYDLKTGKQLWQREALPVLCDGEPEAKARAAQVAIDLARAICMFGGASGQPFGMMFSSYKDLLRLKASPEDAPEFKDKAARLTRMLKKYRPAVEAIGDPDLVKALDADLALTTGWEGLRDPAKILTEYAAKRPTSQLGLACAKKYKVPMSTTWSGYVGFADSTLASDGERVYGVFGQGQVVCYDLDGQMVWARREVTRGGAPFSRPPLLCGDMLILKGAQAQTVLGLDKRAGQVRWETPWKYNNFMALQHVRLTAPDGAPVDVIVTPEHHKIIRVRDGKELGEFRSEKAAPHYQMLAFGDIIAVGGKSTSGPTEPSAFYRLQMTGPDTATGTLVYECEKGILQPMNVPTATDTHFITMAGGVYDRTNGLKVSQLRGGLGSSAVVAGRFVITLNSGMAPYGRNRDDHKVIAGFTVTDITDPKMPKLVSNSSLLGYAEPAVDYVVKDYLGEFDTFLFAGCYRGAASYFGTEMGGVVPQGDCLLIQSSAFLYCIAPPVQGVPTDDPKLPKGN